MAKIMGLKKKAALTNYAENGTMIVPSSGFGTITNRDIEVRRVGDSLHVKGSFRAGTVAASLSYLSIVGETIDSGKITSETQAQGVGTANLVVAAGGGTQLYSTNNGLLVFFDGTDTAKVFIGPTVQTSVIEKHNVTGFMSTGDNITFEFSVPITGWSANDMLRVSDDTKI